MSGTIDGWIRAQIPLLPGTSAELRYERMACQSAEPLPWVHRPADPQLAADWAEQAWVGAFLAALGEAQWVLDVGTGEGWPALPLARWVDRVTAVDASPRRASATADNAAKLGLANVEVACASAEQLPFPDRTFAGVAAATSLEQCERPEAALAEVLRVLEPGGLLAATFEDLRPQLKAPVEEEAELYLAGEEGIYRLVHRSASPPREAEYELRLRATDAVRRAAGQVTRVPRVPATPEEPGLRPVSPDDPQLGVPFLTRVHAEVIGGRYFELTHLTPDRAASAAVGAGFADVRTYGPITTLANPFFAALKRTGGLADLAPHMDRITRALGGLYPFVPLGRTSVFFLVGRRP
ncbi:MAG: class I SAM-dependent methyltransferase [Candidatus Bipolaricaulaceae bacterium]